ncbi:MAG: cofactor-independent phosphoglycerate mutase [Oscillospiraceae bacterium]|nr:cofactor-independent phosphoglycerate mutase [Oscillospiraceae bacterium]
MKYLVLLCDGMADYPCEELGGKTPMQAAKKTNMNRLAEKSEIGLVKTVADHLSPGSDVANLSVMGYDPALYYAGRSPLEAASIGIDLKTTDVAMRCNLVTLSDEPDYSRKTMVDYCGGDIGTEEAAELIHALAERFNSDAFTLYPGFSYRHCLVWDHGLDDILPLTPPHDISGRVVGDYLPSNPNAAPLLEMMRESYEILMRHPVNLARIERGLRPANSMWFWGSGRYKPLAPFAEKFGLKGAVISAVDLIKGIGKLAEMDVIDVPGATGYIDTNFDGKAEAAVKALESHDFIYLHVEAPDECGHRFELKNKVRAIELIDQKILGPVLEALEQYGDYKVMILPDHPTPVSLKTHTRDAVPYLIYHKEKPAGGSFSFDESGGQASGRLVEHGPSLMQHLLEG